MVLKILPEAKFGDYSELIFSINTRLMSGQEIF